MESIYIYIYMRYYVGDDGYCTRDMNIIAFNSTKLSLSLSFSLSLVIEYMNTYIRANTW